MKRTKQITIDPEKLDVEEFRKQMDEYEHNLRRIPKDESRSFRVLTNDPSLTAWGWAILNASGEIIQAGCIKTKPEQKKRRIRKGDDNMRRINEINVMLRKLIEGYSVNYILAELPHGSQNASAARMIGMVAGMLQTISDWTDIAIEWYSEADAKKAALGRISATKAEMIAIMEIEYSNWRTLIKYKDEAIADALAIHNVAMQQSPTLKFWKS